MLHKVKHSFKQEHLRTYHSLQEKQQKTKQTLHSHKIMHYSAKQFLNMTILKLLSPVRMILNLVFRSAYLLNDSSITSQTSLFCATLFICLSFVNIENVFGFSLLPLLWLY